MVHVSLHWSKYGANLELWGFVVKHVVWLHNCIPNCLSSFIPMELLTKIMASHYDLLHTCAWGCIAHKKHCISSHFSVPGNPNNWYSPERLLFTTHLSVVSKVTDRWQKKGVRTLGDTLVLLVFSFHSRRA